MRILAVCWIVALGCLVGFVGAYGIYNKIFPKTEGSSSEEYSLRGTLMSKGAASLVLESPDNFLEGASRLIDILVPRDITIVSVVPIPGTKQVLSGTYGEAINLNFFSPGDSATIRVSTIGERFVAQKIYTTARTKNE